MPAKARRLPGMENAGIPELESMAEALDNVRHKRIKLSKQEGDLQDDLLALMKKHKKHEYHHEDIHAWREVSEEKVKVKIGELDPKKAKKVATAVKESKATDPDEEEQEESPDGEEPAEEGEEESQAGPF